MAPLPFRTLLHRYFFFGWLFLDAGRGSRAERAAAWRHNRAAARWLPSYLQRWCTAGVGLALLGHVIEQGLGAPAWSALGWVPFALSVAVDAVIVVAWLGFRALPAP